MPDLSVNSPYTPETALTWFEFITARLAEDSSLTAAERQERLRLAQAEHQSFTDAWQSDDPDAIENEWWGLKNIANQWRTHPEFPEPISDGTLPCPIPSPDTGNPCVKPVHRGWTPSEGHGGGHFWQSPRAAELEAAGAHYDAGRLLSGQPTPWHLPKDCTPACHQWRDRSVVATDLYQLDRGKAARQR